METKVNKRLIALFGASGHAKVIIDILEKAGDSKLLGVFDDDESKHGASLWEYPVLGGREALLDHVQQHSGLELILSIGVNGVRMRLAEWCRERGIAFGTAIHPTAVIGKHVSIGNGTVVMATSVVNPDARLGEHVIVNTGATVDHDCVIGNGVHLAPGVSICGGVSIGEATLIGVGARILPNLKIGSHVVIGGGAVVTRPIPDGVTVVGCPAAPAISRLRS